MTGDRWKWTTSRLRFLTIHKNVLDSAADFVSPSLCMQLCFSLPPSACGCVLLSSLPLHAAVSFYPPIIVGASNCQSWRRHCLAFKLIIAHSKRKDRLKD